MSYSPCLLLTLLDTPTDSGTFQSLLFVIPGHSIPSLLPGYKHTCFLSPFSHSVRKKQGSEWTLYHTRFFRVAVPVMFTEFPLLKWSQFLNLTDLILIFIRHDREQRPSDINQFPIWKGSNRNTATKQSHMFLFSWKYKSGLHLIACF